MGRRTTLGLAGLVLGTAGLAVLAVVEPRTVPPVVGAVALLILLVVGRSHAREQAAIAKIAASVASLQKRRKRQDDLLRRLYVEVLAVRDLHEGVALSTHEIKKATERLAVGGPGVAPSALFHQLEALLGLYSIVRPRRELPRLGGWPTSPEMLMFLYGEVRSRRPDLVLEYGSGVSTVVMAYGLEHNGSGSIISLEHDPMYAEHSRQLIAEHGLEADIRLAPLRTVEIDGSTYQWYDPDALPEGPVSLLFVDGPPGNVGPRARLPGFPLLVERMAADGVVVVDDYDRPDERDVVQSWLSTSQGWTVRELEMDRGGALLYRT